MTNLYPVLLAVYPVLALLASNMGEIPTSDAYRSLGIAIVGGLGLVGVMSLTLRSMDKGALLSAGHIVLFFAYGHVYDQIEGISIGPVVIGRHRYLLAAWTLAAIAWTVCILRRGQAFSGMKKALQVSGLVLVVFPLVNVTRYYLVSTVPAGGLEPIATADTGSPSGAEEYPDIFYIILDAYGRSDVLKELYSVDNTDFLDFLKSRGFYVATKSTSNYSRTVLSLASSLNMQYMNHIAEGVGRESQDLRPLDKLVARSTVRDVFERMGYQFAAFETGYEHTAIRDAGLFLSPRYDTLVERTSLFWVAGANEFEVMLLGTSLLRAADELYTRSQDSARGIAGFVFHKRRTQVLFALDSLAGIATMGGPHFVFAHVVSPHGPFVFGRHCEEVAEPEAFSRASDYLGTRVRQYGDQTVCVSVLVERAIEGILASSETPPIIIVQSDHGPSAFGDAGAATEIGMWERMAILNAYLVPEGARSLLYPTITPVNSFRAILSGAFGADLDLLEDSNYFSTGEAPYDLGEVTDTTAGQP